MGPSYSAHVTRNEDNRTENLNTRKTKHTRTCDRSNDGYLRYVERLKYATKLTVE